MTLVEYCLFLVLGRLITWFVQTAGPFEVLWSKHPKLMEFGRCDLCVGFWVCFGLALLTEQRVLDLLWPQGLWGPLEDVLLAAITAFITHLLVLGWSAKFKIVTIE